MKMMQLISVSDQTRYELTPTQIFVGRSSDCQIRINVPEISKQHCLLEYQNQVWVVTDKGSSNGTYLNQERLTPHQPYALKDGDILAFHTYVYRLQAIQPRQSDSQQDQTAFMSGERNPGTVMARNLKVTPGSEVSIGRGTENSICISSPLVSRQHARIVVENTQAVLYDLQSTNGVYVNGQRIAGKYALKGQDLIQIADARIRYSGLNEELTALDERNNIRFDAIKISKTTSDGKKLLQDISFTVMPGEFITILGGSGAGKSTTLDALNGFRPASTGRILVNGEDYYANFASYQPILGYVPQSDIIHEQLTVEEALDFAAKLRLSSDLSSVERSQQVRKVMRELGLAERHDVPIRNLSGGQKKRVSIGVELLCEPSLFFLDEPTSGLDPGTEREMMRMMRELANQGKTVFLITHAVGNLDYCHQILFLAMGGRVAYYGPPSEMVAYFHGLNPQINNIPDIYNLMGTAEGADFCVEQFKKSTYYQKYILERNQQLKTVQQQNALPEKQVKKPKASFLRQLVTFSARYLNILLKDPKSLMTQFLQTPVIAMLIMLAFNLNIFKSSSYELRSMAPSLLFILTCVSVWFGTSNSAQEIIKEIDIYLRERMVNLRIFPYVVSKVLVQALIGLIQCLTLVAMVCPVFGIDSRYWIEIFFTLWLSCFTGSMLGLAISALSVSREMAVVLVPLVLIPQIMFSGAITKVQDMSPAGEIVSVITSNRWSYQALGNITGMNNYIKAPEDAPSAKRDEPYNRSFSTDKRIDWQVNGLMSFILFLLTLFFLKLRDIR